MGKDSSPRWLVASIVTWCNRSGPESPLAPHRARCCAPLFGLVRSLPPAAVQRGRAQSSPCASPESPCRSARSPYRSLPGRLFAGTWCSGKVSPRGEARCSGASSSRILPENHSISASSDRMILLQSRPRPAYAARKVGSPPVGSGRCSLRRIIRPAQARLVPLRFACSSNLLSVLLRRPGEQITEAPVICSPSSCVGQESRLLKPACRSAQTPSGVFLFFRSLRSRKSTGRCASSCDPAFSCSLRSIVLLN